MGDTQFMAAPTNGESSTILKVSVRAWIALSVSVGIVGNHLLVTIFVLIHALTTGDFDLVGSLTTVGEPYYSLAVASIAFYFGQKTTKP
jgi:hypothetical protein